jgi:hypothetical protein
MTDLSLNRPHSLLIFTQFPSLIYSFSFTFFDLIFLPLSHSFQSLPCSVSHSFPPKLNLCHSFRQSLSYALIVALPLLVITKFYYIHRHKTKAKRRLAESIEPTQSQLEECAILVLPCPLIPKVLMTCNKGFADILERAQIKAT